MFFAKPATSTEISMELYICVIGDASGVGGRTTLAAIGTTSGENTDSVGEMVVPVPAPDPEEGAVLDISVGSSCNPVLFSQ